MAHGGKRNRLLASTFGRLAITAAIVCVAPAPASAYVGTSFLIVPGIPGDWKGKQYTGSIQVLANIWGDGVHSSLGSGRSGARSPRVFIGPGAPRSGEGRLVVSVAKDNPVFGRLMEACQQKSVMPEMKYAESAARQRSMVDLGPVPEGTPAYFEYKLKNVRFAECLVVAGAPEQAFILQFEDAEWLNYAIEKDVPVAMLPAKLGPKETSGQTKAFALTWFAVANDVSDNHCPVMSEKPSDDDYYRYMTSDEAVLERTKLKGVGGINYRSGILGLRGPQRLNVAMLPGIVPDPGLPSPKTNFARGLDLDGHSGEGAPPPGIRPHKNYVSKDGRTGIDNQLFSVIGCVPGWHGRKGFITQYNNNARKDGGSRAMLIEISGIDNERNDDAVTITWTYSDDRMAKNAGGEKVLADYTFRVATAPEQAYYHARVRGRIVDGRIVSDPMSEFRLDLGGVSGTPPELVLWNSRIELEIEPDGNLRGVLGGYLDWKRFVSTYITSSWEGYYQYTQPGLYNAFIREADGITDPLTGEYDRVSAGFDIEGVPAFIAAPAPTNLAQGGSGRKRTK